MLEKYDLDTLDKDFMQVLNGMQTHHDTQRDHVNFYNHSAFYARKPGDPKPNTQLSVNLLKAFADKNIAYTSKFPTIKVPHKATDAMARMRCSMIEKVYYATHEANHTEHKQKLWATDGTLKSEAVAVTSFDFKQRLVKIDRYDPQYCYFKYANDNDSLLLAFYIAVPMLKEQVKKKFGVEPTTSGISPSVANADGNPVRIDGLDRFWVIYRWDIDTFSAWVGDKWLQAPMRHDYGFIPVDRCQPFETGQLDHAGGFFMDPLLPLQAEYNDVFRRRSAFVKKSGKPTLWGRGIIANQWDEVKRAAAGEGGAIGLKNNGELGFLTPPGTDLFDTHLDRLFEMMKNIAGFPTATFGEIAGANTSGDALSMYFQPTTQAVERQWLSWKQFYAGINEKIGRLYQQFLRADEEKELYGHFPAGTFEYLVDFNDQTQQFDSNRRYNSGGYGVTFDKYLFENYFRSVIITPSATPKDEIGYKKLIMDAVNSNFMSHIEGYEEWGIVDPEDSLDLLSKEREDPRLHPDVLAAASSALQANPGMGGPEQPPPGMPGVPGMPGQPIDSANPGGLPALPPGPFDPSAQPAGAPGQVPIGA